MIIHECLQGSPEWFALRVGIPSASGFARMVTGTGAVSKSLHGYARELAAELFVGKSLDAFDGNTWMDRGKEKEADAVSLYEFTNDLAVLRVGFVTNDAKTAGCSPDGLVGDDGGLEIKCLKAESHLEVVEYHKKHGICPPKYYPQVQGSLLVSERKWWDQMFYHPDLPPLVVRNVPDLEWQAKLRSAVAEVIQERDRVLENMRHDQQHISDKTSSPMEAG